LKDPRTGVITHLEGFRSGGSFLIPESALKRFVRGQRIIGDPDGQFITTIEAMDQLLLEASGDLNLVKKRLAIPHQFWNEPLIRIDIHNPLLHNVRLPVGFERGSNSMFRWGGYTSGGLPEIVIDPFLIEGATVSRSGVKP
jgi:hypothetical protein